MYKLFEGIIITEERISFVMKSKIFSNPIIISLLGGLGAYVLIGIYKSFAEKMNLGQSLLNLAVKIYHTNIPVKISDFYLIILILILLGWMFSINRKLRGLSKKIQNIFVENEKLREENKNIKHLIDNSVLSEKKKIKNSLKFEDNTYYRIDKAGKVLDGPFCSNCWDKDGKLIRLHESKKDYFKKEIWCPACKTYGGPK